MSMPMGVKTIMNKSTVASMEAIMTMKIMATLCLPWCQSSEERLLSEM